MRKKHAIEMMVLNPEHAFPKDNRGVIENLWIKQRFEHYLSIGVYKEGSDVKYYFFKDCERKPTGYYSLDALKSALQEREDFPTELKDIFDNNPKLFIMGHSQGGFYGQSNHHDNKTLEGSEVISGEQYDQIIDDFKSTLSDDKHGEIFITSEGCNTDNCGQAKDWGEEKTFLEKLSAKHKNITFSGTGPWGDDNNAEKGFRAAGGETILNVPVTSIIGGVWKHGNSVVFHHGDNQVVVVKSKFASTETAKDLKINTIEYARAVLESTNLDKDTKKNLIAEICANRKVLEIKDLKRVDSFPKRDFNDPEFENFKIQEKTY